MTDTPPPPADLRALSARFRAQRETIRSDMGGLDKIARVHARGRITIRERIESLVDPGSFNEIGTFARSAREDARDVTPGDGKLGGFASIDGRPVAVLGDDVTVLSGSSSLTGQIKKDRIEHYAVEQGFPIVFLGEAGGGRLPDQLGAEGFGIAINASARDLRNRRVPQVTAIVGSSFGASSMEAGLSDLVIQHRDAVMALTGPRVIELASTEKVGMAELGGAEVHAAITGQTDVIAEDDADLNRQIKAFLSYMPANAWTEAPRTPWDGDLGRDEGMYDLVPLRRQRSYDVRKVIGRLTDDGAYFEIKERFARQVVVALGRVAGRSVGFIATQPSYQAGVLTPDTCDKMTMFVCLCEAFNLPIIVLQDVPGFMVGKTVEHARIVSRAIMFRQAFSQSTVPKIVVITRKAFGLALGALGGSRESTRVLAWPSAEISFMDPEVGVNIVYGEKLKEHADPEGERRRLIAEWSLAQHPEGAAGIMALDEIIDPAETRAWLRREVDRVHVRIPRWGETKPLACWPTSL